jgi:HlyD family secretion protein
MQTQPPTNPLTTAQPPDNNHPPTLPNNSLQPAPNRLPKARGWKRRRSWLIALLLLLTAGGTGFGGWYFYARKYAVHPELVLHKIEKKILQITITERGSLEPADNTFFSCKVKAKSQGGAATNIRWVIDNGSFVREGDKILQLDDSALKDLLTTQEVTVSKAEQAWRQADLTRTINKLKNEAAVKTNETNLKVAMITLQEYLEGQFVQLQVDLQNKLDMSRSDLFMWEERAAWSERMSRPGRQYVTVSQAEADESRRKTAALTRKSLETQMRVLETLTKKKNQVDLQGKIEEAERQLELARQTLEKTLKSDDVGVDSAYLQYSKEMSRLADIQQEINDCEIRAPRDGMVVYYVEERARWGQTAGIIAQGEQVKEGQKLIAVPDLSQMVVNARIHEAMVPQVRDDKVKNTGFTESVNTALLFSPNPISALSAYVAFDAELQASFANKHEELEKHLEQRGMDAIVRVSAFRDRALKGHVKFVAPVASQADLFGSDVKVYQTYIAIDDTNLKGLKPGMDAVVEIKVDSTPEPVLTIPLQALLGGVEMGDKRRCFVMVDGRPELREITLGKTNELFAEVKEGLKEGDEVVFNPAKLLTDKEKVQYGVSTSSSQDSGRGGPGGDKASWGGKGKSGKDGKGWPGKGKGGMQGAPGGMQGGPGGGFGGGRRSQGGAAPGSKTPANP